MRIRIRRPFALSLAATLCCGMLSATNWLTALRDDTPVNRLSIPGTHDSATGEGFAGLAGALAGERRARTQDVGLDAQWESGIRAFDLRPATSSGGKRKKLLTICHGIVRTRMYFDEALKLLCKKVEENPGEFAIVIIRREDSGRNSRNEMWQKLVRESLHRARQAGRLADFRPGLTIGDLRGKVLVLSRDVYENRHRPAGGYIRGWSHSENSESQKGAVIEGPEGAESPLCVQDCYDCTQGRLDAKLRAIRAMLNESARLATAADSPQTWVINHASGYTSRSSAGYRDNATHTNTAVIDHLKHSGGTGATGIVMMDYAAVQRSKGYAVRGLELTQVLIACNAIYTAPQSTKQKWNDRKP